jgi:hypothetical protein
MPRPRLIHPVDLTIEPIDTPATTYDRQAREPVKQAARATQVQVEAQVQWSAQDDPVASDVGILERNRGYVLFRTEDLEAISYEPARGDRIVTIGPMTGLDLYLADGEPCGHYDGQPWLRKFDFVDRQPTRRP